MGAFRSVSNLAREAGVEPSMVQRAEADEMLPLNQPNLEPIQRALEATGVEFSPENGRAGVRTRAQHA